MRIFCTISARLSYICGMNTLNIRVFLYGGLSLLLLAFVVRAWGVPSVYFWGLFAAAILLKSIFLFGVFRLKGFRLTPGMCLILAGVAMMLVSFLFKTVYPLPVIRILLFCGAISLKSIGLIWMLLDKSIR